MRRGGANVQHLWRTGLCCCPQVWVVVRNRHRMGLVPEIALAFLRMGLIAFGGPAAHLALLEDEFVTRRGWLTRQRFLDLMGATNLIPGPNSTEMTMHLGYERGGALGLFVAGTSFVLPAAALTGLLAWCYLEFGALPGAAPVLAAIRPAVLIVILGAIWKLGRKAITDWRLGAIAAGVAGLVWLGLGEVPALVVGGVLGMLCLRVPHLLTSAVGFLGLLCVPVRTLLASGGEQADLAKLGLFFVKVGSVLYGSGYVLIAFLEGGLVDDYGWVTRQQLLDAVAAGQFTPGPVLTTATFLGFLVGGPSGAAIATLGIFLPAFVFAWILNPLVRRLRQSPTSAAFLDAINASAVGLMAVVAIDLARTALSSGLAIGIAVAAAVALFFGRWSAVWVIVAAAVLGWISMAAGLV